MGPLKILFIETKDSSNSILCIVHCKILCTKALIGDCLQIIQSLSDNLTKLFSNKTFRHFKNIFYILNVSILTTIPSKSLETLYRSVQFFNVLRSMTSIAEIATN